MQPTDSVNANDLSTTLPGTLFAERFEIRRCVGTGGTSTVFAAFDRAVSRDVAVKILHPWLLEERSQKRFLQEAKTLSRLSHPNILQTYRCGQWDRFYYIVMELSTGQSLSEILKSSGKFSVDDTINIAKQAAAALGAAHAQGVIHRDVKPGNIMVTTDGGLKVQLVDFGVAKFVDVKNSSQGLTATDHIVGTPIYMSPEQCLKKELTPQSDTYSLGCVIYQMLTGEQPFSGDTPFNVMYQHLEGTLPQLPSEIPTWLCQLVYSMVGKECKDRPATMDDIVEALTRRNFAMVSGRQRRKKRPSKIPIITVSALVAVSASGFFAYAWLNQSGNAASPKEVFAAASKKYDADIAAKRTDEAFEDALTAARANYDIACGLGQGTDIKYGHAECQAVTDWINKAVLAATVNGQPDYSRTIKAQWALASMEKLPISQRSFAAQAAISACSTYANEQFRDGHKESAMALQEQAVAYLSDFRHNALHDVRDPVAIQWRRDLICSAGETAFMIQDFRKAKKYYLELVDTEHSFEPESLNEGYALLQAAQACNKLGEAELSKSLESRGRSCLAKLNPPPGLDRVRLASVYVKLGNRFLENGKLSQSEQDAKRASQLLNSSGLTSLEAAAPRHLLAELCVKLRDYVNAHQHYMRCLEIYRLNSANKDFGILQASIYSGLASIEELKGNYPEAIRLLIIGLDVGEKGNSEGRHTQSVESVRMQLGFARLHVGDKKGANELGLETVRRLTPSSQLIELGTAYELLANSSPDPASALVNLKLAGKACRRTGKRDCNCVNIGLHLSNEMSGLEKFDEALLFAAETERIATTKPKRDEKAIKTIQDLATYLKLRIASQKHS